MTSGTTYDLKAIYGSGASDIYAVGYTIGPPSLSVILHYDGTSWTPQSSGLANAQLAPSSSPPTAKLGLAIC